MYSTPAVVSVYGVALVSAMTCMISRQKPNSSALFLQPFLSLSCDYMELTAIREDTSRSGTRTRRASKFKGASGLPARWISKRVFAAIEAETKDYI